MKISFNHDEFLQYKYNHKSIFRLKIEKILKNKSFQKTIILIGATSIMILKPNCCFATGTSKIDKAGNMFLEIVKHAGYWIILIVGICNIIKTATTTNNSSDILKVIIKYILIYSSLFILPWGFDLVEGVFS